MRINSALRVKSKIKGRAKAAHVSPALMMQDYLLERLLERVSVSRWKENVILRGGMLVAALMGVDSRVTRDIDITVAGIPFTHESLALMAKEICSVPLDDDVTFEFVDTNDFRNADDYAGIHIFVIAHYESLSVPLTVDVTTGEAITPDPVEYDFPLQFDDKTIKLMAYPPVTCMAEKLETVISHGAANARPRDYYDVFKLWRGCRDAITPELLGRALTATATVRGTLDQMRGYRAVMAEVASDEETNSRWVKFACDCSYVGELNLREACATVVSVMDSIEWPAPTAPSPAPAPAPAA